MVTPEVTKISENLLGDITKSKQGGILVQSSQVFDNFFCVRTKSLEEIKNEYYFRDAANGEKLECCLEVRYPGKSSFYYQLPIRFQTSGGIDNSISIHLFFRN